MTADMAGGMIADPITPRFPLLWSVVKAIGKGLSGIYYYLNDRWVDEKWRARAWLWLGLPPAVAYFSTFIHSFIGPMVVLGAMVCIWSFWAMVILDD